MSPVSEQIRIEIAKQGAISFARFMELALYCPLCGYYEKKADTTGQGGDFYTSVSVGPLFGELLAFQFAEWLGQLQTGERQLQIVEAGSHDGRLAKDILTWLKLRRPKLFGKMEYWIIEPSTRRQDWQREALNEFVPRVRWFRGLGLLERNPSAGQVGYQFTYVHYQSVSGVIFANELLDAMVLHRLGWDAKRREWFEWGVTFLNGRFAWTRLTRQAAVCNRHSTISNLPQQLLDVLPDGFTIEICPAAEEWWRAAVSVLRLGKLLTLDYGLCTEEFFAPQRATGTLRAYHRHRLTDDVLANPGEQDLTAHVNFSAIQRIGEAAGLRTDLVASQERFLTGIAERVWREGNSFGTWTSEQARQFQTLTHPDHLGRSFRVLIQSVHGQPRQRRN